MRSRSGGSSMTCRAERCGQFGQESARPATSSRSGWLRCAIRRTSIRKLWRAPIGRTSPRCDRFEQAFLHDRQAVDLVERQGAAVGNAAARRSALEGAGKAPFSWPNSTDSIELTGSRRY
jgi:hypothetical protein